MPQDVPTEEDFDTAFAQLAELAEGKEPVAAPAAEPAAEAPAATQDAPEQDAPEQDEPDEEPPAEEDDLPAQDTLSDEELLARFAALVKKADPAPQQPAAPPPQAQKPQEPPVYTPEEAEFLQTYEQDWPDVAKAEALRRRAEYRQLVGYVFQEVAKEFKPIMEAVEVLSQRTHLSDLQTTVTDYEDVRDKVVAWVDTQPAYLQAAYKHVINQGTVEEVADLIDRYKRETGVTPTATPAPVRKDADLPTATKQAAAALAPVSSKRSAVVQAADPNDFEAAFASFADKL